MNERHLPAMRRFVEALSREQHAFERELLDDAQAKEERTLRTRLFADSFVKRLDAAVEYGAPEMFERWLEEATAERAPFRPAETVARAIPRALARTAAHRRFLPIASDWIDEIDTAIASAFETPRSGAPVARVDEVDAAIDDLLAGFERSDPLTGDHSRAVGAWCNRIARALGLHDAEARELARAGLVHDVGKLQVPAAMLAAPRALDDREWEIMRAHTRHGEELARKHAVLEPYLHGIVFHHERLDGSGYPCGLRGDAIPFQARVVAVADAFNAMIGRRPYRPAFAPQEALRELHACAGPQYDPDIVAALERVLHV